MKTIFSSRKFLSGALSLCTLLLFVFTMISPFLFAKETNAQSCGNVTGGACQSAPCVDQKSQIPDSSCKGGKICCGFVEPARIKYCDGGHGSCGSCTKGSVWGDPHVSADCFDQPFTTCCWNSPGAGAPENGIECEGTAGCYEGSCVSGTIPDTVGHGTCAAGYACCSYGVPPPATCASLNKQCLLSSECAGGSLSNNATGCTGANVCCSPIPPPATCASQSGQCIPGNFCGAGKHEGTGTCAAGQLCCISDATPPPPSGTCAANDFSGGLVKCGKGTNPMECDFTALICLLQRIMNFLMFVMAIPLAAISFAYAGYLYMSSGFKPGNIAKAHEIFFNVGVIGLPLMLAAWLIVHAIVKGLGVAEVYNFLGN